MFNYELLILESLQCLGDSGSCMYYVIYTMYYIVIRDVLLVFCSDLSPTPLPPARLPTGRGASFVVPRVRDYGGHVFVFCICLCSVWCPMDEDTRVLLRKKHKCKFTKKLRRKMTNAEGILWEELRRHSFHGIKFRRQVNIGKYIADFLCWRHNLIIEVDGKIHEQQKEYDKERDEYLRGRGFRILRITNEEVLSDISSVLKKIEQTVSH